MRVSDLIKNTVWLPSSNYDMARPLISVLLPTFRRGRDGSFLKAANSILAPRAILEDVGLFDPHVAAARLCDWDLWRRILKKYPIHRTPVFMGIEYGHTRADSLENTYPLFEEALQEYFSVDRNEGLRRA